MGRLHEWLHHRAVQAPRVMAIIALVIFVLAAAVVMTAAHRGGTVALSNPANASPVVPPLRLFALLTLILVGYWVLGLRPRWSQIWAMAVIGLTVSWALAPYEEDSGNEVAAAMREQGVYYANVGDVFGIAALLLSIGGGSAALAMLLFPQPAHHAFHVIGSRVGEVLSGSLALPVVASAFVLAVFSGDAWESMATTPGQNIAGLVLALALSAAWLLNRATPQPWWLVVIVVTLLFFVLILVFLLTTSLLVQPETSLGWVDSPLPEGVADMEGARMKLASIFAGVAVLAMVNAEKPEMKGSA